MGKTLDSQVFAVLKAGQLVNFTGNFACSSSLLYTKVPTLNSCAIQFASLCQLYFVCKGWKKHHGQYYTCNTISNIQSTQTYLLFIMLWRKWANRISKSNTLRKTTCSNKETRYSKSPLLALFHVAAVSAFPIKGPCSFRPRPRCECCRVSPYPPPPPAATLWFHRLLKS